MPRLAVIALAFCALALPPAGRPALAQVTVNLSCSSLGIELDLCRSGAEAWAAKTSNKVKLVTTPADANQRLALYQTLLSAQSADVDVFQIDVIWPGTLAEHFIDLKPYVSENDLAEHFDPLIRNDTVDGRLVAMPWFVDAGLLYYRRDLLKKYDKKVPNTWDDLEATAKAIVEAEAKDGNHSLQGYVWQGRAYEGLTCNALEWVASNGGGTIIEGGGSITVNNARATAALTRAAGWVGTISPPGVLNYAEEDARGVFQTGDAVFMRNWPYAWALANAADSPVHDKVGVSPLPRGTADGGRHAATLGGQQLAVSRYSAHKGEAIDLVLYLTGAEEQKRRAIAGSLNPTLRSLYHDREVLYANPFYAEFGKILETAVARPSTATRSRYNQVSSAFTRAVHAILSGRTEPRDAMAELTETLRSLRRQGRW